MNFFKKMSWQLRISFTVLILYGIVLKISELWFEEFYKHWLQKYLEYKVPTIFFVLISFVLLSLVSNYYKKKIEKLKEQIENKAATLAYTYEELETYKQFETLRDEMARFIAKEEYVHAVQLYRYTMKHHGDKVIFKVNHVDGVVHEQIPLNAMMQVYYSIDRNLYNEYLRVMKAFDEGKYDRVIKFMHRIGHDLSIKPIAESDENFVQQQYKYAILKLCEDILSSTYHLDIVNPFLDPDKIKKLKNNLRTGILRGILNRYENFYMFDHDGEGEKRGRVYLTRHYYNEEIDGYRYIFVLTLDPSVLQQLHVNHDYLIKLDKRLEKRMESSRVLHYNKKHEVEGGETYARN